MEEFVDKMHQKVGLAELDLSFLVVCLNLPQRKVWLSEHGNTDTERGERKAQKPDERQGRISPSISADAATKMLCWVKKPFSLSLSLGMCMRTSHWPNCLACTRERVGGGAETGVLAMKTPRPRKCPPLFFWERGGRIQGRGLGPRGGNNALLNLACLLPSPPLPSEKWVALSTAGGGSKVNKRGLPALGKTGREREITPLFLSSHHNSFVFFPRRWRAQRKERT